MPHEFATFIGVDSAAGRHPFTYVALDAQRKLLALGGGSAADVLAYAAGQHSALLALSPPERPGSHHPAHPGEPPLPIYPLTASRPFQLDLSGETRESASPQVPAWLAACVDLTDRLAALGYQAFPQDAAVRQWLEAPAASGFHAWLGLEPLDALTLEGRLQRQLILEDLGLDVPDAMEFFEEITRFKLLHGQVPYQRVLPLAEINATMAANTAWLAGLHPAEVQRFGQPGVYYPRKPGA